ncbi:very short patch repair endonuclease [Promicromonospora sp. NPDC050880]|uniref:very short patch repair endonuclease n=1 Tax=Promicromonospora sp. NPDC050880 TaxID=3364406 RepID=UPI003789DCE9
MAGMPQDDVPVAGYTLVPQRVSAHPGSSSTNVSARMSRARRRDTAPEIALRQELHARGLRYRVAFPVPGQRRRSIDVAFTRVRVAVFVDGCFWHGCPEHGTRPRSNSTWWREKLAANAARDADTNQALNALGWEVLRVWEHEPSTSAADLVEELVRSRSLS